MSIDADGADKVVPLGLIRQAHDSPSMAAGQIRRHLSLLQGYADLMVGVSPAQAVRIMRIMAEKVDDLTETIRPFMEADHESRPTLERYRKARTENRELMAEYRLLLRRLRQSVNGAKAVRSPRYPSA
ncbi:MAG TPA: hypothetical protein VIT43_03470 [Candidatus Dormibacteraeota bacterium]